MDADAVERALAEFRHEAANPVALMQSALRELDRHAELSDDGRELVEVVRRQADVLVRLLQRLRGVGEGELTPDARPRDLAELVDEVVADLRLGLLADRDCRVTADEAVVVDVDDVLLGQALTNLLDNAVKYSPNGTVIHVTVQCEGELAALWVEDQGSGVAPEDQQRIFRRFERGHDDIAGLGLGLAVVRRVAEAHGGAVEALPAPAGRGTRFVLTLPLAQVAS